MNDTIHLIATGGTIDSVFHAPKEGSLVKEKTGLPNFLNTVVMPHFNIKTTQLCMVDSGDITDDHRGQMVRIIQDEPEHKFLITHGTNTMTETLSYLDKELSSTQKTVILTGSMIPLEGFSPTDSGFNLGYAIAHLEHLTSGVYLAMNGKLFKNNEVKKNFQIARFEHKEAS